MPSKVNNKLEQVFLATGYSHVIGVDEVGRGSWAGPVVVGAFVYKTSTRLIQEVNDSKKLTFKKRERLSQVLQGDEHSIGLAEVREIDKYNILEATRLAINRAVEKVKIGKALVLVDGYFRDPFDFDYKCIVRGDEKHYTIAAASILAKVYRDNLMIKLSSKYPDYGFETNVGYGTAKHRDALAKYGVCEIHRRSYRPIKELVSGNR